MTQYIDESSRSYVQRERFLPLTIHALLDRLSDKDLWPSANPEDARRFLRYLDNYQHSHYGLLLRDLQRLYEPFSPDTDLLQPGKLGPMERYAMQKEVVGRISDLLTQANFTRVDPKLLAQDHGLAAARRRVFVCLPAVGDAG